MSNVEIVINARDNATKSIKGVNTALGDMDKAAGGAGKGVAGFAQNITKMAQTAAAAGVALAAAGVTIKKAWDFAKEGAELLKIQGQFENLAASIGADAGEMQAALEAAAGGMVSSAELTASAAQIISLGLADSQESVVRLSTVVSKLGWDMSQVVLTFANNSKMRLDALGLSVTDVNERMAALQAQGMSMDQAFDMAVIEAGEAKLQLLGDAAETAAGQMRMIEADVKNLMDAMKQGFAERLSPVFAAASGRNADMVRELARQQIEAANSLEGLIDLYERFSSQQKSVEAAVTGTSAAFGDMARETAEAIALQADSFQQFFEAIGADQMGQAALDALVRDLGMSLQEFYNLTRQVAAASSADLLFANYRDILPEVIQNIIDATDELDKYRETLEKIEQDKLLDQLEITDETFARLVLQLGSTSEAFEYLRKVQEDVAKGGGAYEVSADQVSEANDEIRVSADEAAAAARALAEEIGRIGQGAARENFTVLEDLAQARRDLADASGEWVQGEKDNSERIAEINAQLANDLTDEQRKQWDERVDIITEGSQEYLNRVRRMEEDLSESERRALILERAELMAEQGSPVSLFTGDLQGMEDAEEKVKELEKALRDNLTDAMIEAQEATAGFGEGTIDLREALGLIDSETADAERTMLRVADAAATLGKAVGEGTISPEVAASLFQALEDAALGTEEELQAIMERIANILAGKSTVWQVSDPRQAGGVLKDRMLSEVEGIESEMAEKGSAAGSALKEGMLAEIELVENAITGLPGLAAANPLDVQTNATVVVGELDSLKAKLLELDGLTITTTVNTVGGGAGGGGGGTGGGAEVFAASGFMGTVPPGFPNDSFTVTAHMTSGETLDIRPPGQGGGAGGATYVNAPQVTVFASSILHNPAALAGRVKQVVSDYGTGGR